MKVLVLGGTGATGRLLVKQLLDRGHEVSVLIRPASKLPAAVKDHASLTVVRGELFGENRVDVSELVAGCDAVASCLGHNMTWKGIYGKPRRLVRDAVRNVCEAVQKSQTPGLVKVVLMNTSGNRNRDLDEPISFAQKIVIGLLRLLMPPHVDNEQAADYLRTRVDRIGGRIEWAAVRPDGLIDADEVSDYSLHPSPLRSAIFDAGHTSRINVAHFMAELISDDAAWQKWKYQMPVIYNAVKRIVP